METLNKQTFTRQQLYTLVWSQSLLSLSKKYDISDNGLRKLCIRMDIPLPRVGHWEKLKHGKKVEIAKLPISHSAENEITLSLRSENDNKQQSLKSSLASLSKEIQNSSNLHLTIPERLNSPDKLIISAKESLNTKESSYGLYRGVVSTGSKELTIRVAPANVGRALRIMDTLIKSLRKRGHDTEVTDRYTFVVINSQQIKVSIKEKLKRVIINDRAWSNSEYQPTGILTFRIEHYTPVEWKDGKDSLENQLPKIIAKLELHAQELKKREEEIHIYWEKRKEEERIAEELQRRKEKDLNDFKTMLQKSSRWHKAVNLRNYINEVEQNASTNGNLSEEKRQWLVWARKKADWYDPFIEMQDELLNKINRDTLALEK
jgi:hypothetical protein